MLDKKLTPTPLIQQSEKPVISIRPPTRPSIFRVLHVWALFGWFFLTVAALASVRRLDRAGYARRLRRVLEKLGGLWIKVGQLLSLRSDMFSLEFCRELSQLQDTAAGFPTSLAKQIFEEELGAPTEHYFDRFEDIPFAAASIGQIHLARLRREGEWVAVKIQRPHTEWAYTREMALVRFLVSVVKTLWFVPNLHWDEMLWELNQILAEETDYRYEASSTMRMRRMLRKHGIYAPKVYREYSTRRVLVTEYVRAALMSDYIKVHQSDPRKCAAWCAENNIDPHRVARRLFNSLWRQLLEDNLFHGDLHPGNIILLRNSHVALIDFGAVGSMEKEYQQKYTLLMKAMADQYYAKAADLLFMLSGALPPDDLAEVKQKLIRALRAWDLRAHAKGLPYKTRSMSNIANELIKILFQYECSADWSFLRITRAQETVDQSLMHLCPEVNYTTLIRRYFRRADRRTLRSARQPREGVRYLKNMMDAVRIPGQLSENFMFQGWIIRRQAQIFQGSTSKLSHFFGIMLGRGALALMLVGLYLFLVFLHQHHPAWLPNLAQKWFSEALKDFPLLLYSYWVVILGGIAYLVLTLGSLRRRFLKKERSTDDS